MYRAACATFMALLLSAGAARAQSLLPDFQRPTWGPLIRITPFLGQAPALSRLERWTLTGPSGTATANTDVELGSGPVAGISLEVRAIDRLAFLGSFAVISRSRTLYSNPGLQPYRQEGSNFFLAKGALAIRLQEQVSEIQVRSLTATVFAGPAFVREIPKDDPLIDPVLLEPISHWAINFGANAEVPLGWGALSLQAGVEDYYTWWNKAEFARRNDAIILATNGSDANSLVEADPSHMWIFRAGLSLRVR